MSLMEVMTISFYVLIGLVAFIVLVPALYSYAAKSKETKKKVDFKKKISAPLQVLNANTQVKLAYSTAERESFAPPVYNETRMTQAAPRTTQLPNYSYTAKAANKFEILNSGSPETNISETPVSPSHPRNWRANWQ